MSRVVDEFYYRCCFYNKVILEESPSKLNISLFDNRYNQDFFCHKSCFRKRLNKDSKTIFDDIQ